jgi:hypothetical protein
MFNDDWPPAFSNPLSRANEGACCPPQNVASGGSFRYDDGPSGAVRLRVFFGQPLGWTSLPALFRTALVPAFIVTVQVPHGVSLDSFANWARRFDSEGCGLPRARPRCFLVDPASLEGLEQPVAWTILSSAVNRAGVDTGMSALHLAHRVARFKRNAVD